MAFSETFPFGYTKLGKSRQMTRGNYPYSGHESQKYPYGGFLHNFVKVNREETSPPIGELIVSLPT